MGELKDAFNLVYAALRWLLHTIQETPYVMMHYGKNYTGNARFYGFCVDILDSVAKQVGFEYILDLVPDRKYGAKDPITGEWNGMVAQLMKHVSIWGTCCSRCAHVLCFLAFRSLCLSLQTQKLIGNCF